MTPTDLLAELEWRGLLSQHTDGVSDLLASGLVTAYCGFDPSAPSLHVGNLVPVMALLHLQRAGHRPIALVGGGTGMIGDPSGKSSERQLNTPEVVAANTASIREQLGRFLDFEGTAYPAAALMRDNAEWLLSLGAIEFMRDVGKHYTVNYMLQKDSVKSRMEAGISYTEFSYMLLQAYDFLQLARREGALLQIGGSDQWGNITAGIELIRRTDSRHAHALTVPLVTTSDGTKFGKTEAGAVWLDAERTSPYQFYQYWINADDRDVGRFLRFFTVKGREEIAALEAAMREHPERRDAQRALADEVTARVHGAATAGTAAEVSALLFGKGEPGSLSAAALDALAREIPYAALPATEGALDTIAIFSTAFAMSKSEARRMLAQGALSANGRKLEATDATIADEPLAGGRFLLRKGGRSYAVITVG